MQNIKVNVIPKGVSSQAFSSKDDNNRAVKLNLFEDLTPFILAGSESLRLRYKKPSGAVSSFAVENTGASSVILEIPEQMTDEAGLVYCKLHINTISAKGFYIMVEDKP